MTLFPVYLVAFATAPGGAGTFAPGPGRPGYCTEAGDDGPQG